MTIEICFCYCKIILSFKHLTTKVHRRIIPLVLQRFKAISFKPFKQNIETNHIYRINDKQSVLFQWSNSIKRRNPWFCHINVESRFLNLNPLRKDSVSSRLTTVLNNSLFFIISLYVLESIIFKLISSIQ